MSPFGMSVREFFLNLAANVAAAALSPADMIGYLIALCFMLVWIANWHRKRTAGGKRGVDSWYFITLSLIVAGIAIGGAAYGLGLRSVGRAEKNGPQSNAQSQAPTTAPAVLISSRYYSAKNKEEVADRLDAISSSITSTGDEILKDAEIAINGSRWEASPNIDPEIERMNNIIRLFKHMKITLYDHLLDRERDYRVEMNAVLFPQEPFTQFLSGAEQFRDGLSVWKQTRDSDSKDAVLKLVHASRITFAIARQNFVNWLSGRQELIEQARMALKL